jgi:lipoprotein-anchoring transpeptidase ErfK/SrfK
MNKRGINSASRVMALLLTPAALLVHAHAAESGAAAGLTAAAIEEAVLDASPRETPADAEQPDPVVVKLQVLLDRAGASPGVIDGFDGDNVHKAISAFEMMAGLPVDGAVDSDMLDQLSQDGPITQRYVITAEDSADVVGAVPSDYSEMAAMEFLGYETVAEKLAERFHMDVDLLAALNPGASYEAGEEIVVVDPGRPASGEVARIEADKTLKQVRAYGADEQLIAAYPATIGSAENPSPSGTHAVAVVVRMPEYSYNPELNFQQGDNTEPLTIPPGPNGPVGSVWIDLTEPSFGIHGTPEPSLIDKTASHGCVRLTNWDADELGNLVSEGVPVAFVG